MCVCVYPHAGLCQIRLKIALICWNYCFFNRRMVQ